MLSLKTLAILCLPGMLAAVFWFFGRSGDLLEKGNVALEHLLPPTVNAVLMHVMRFLDKSDIEWTPMGAKSFDPIVQIRGFRDARDLVFMDSPPGGPAEPDVKHSSSRITVNKREPRH